MTGAVAHLWRHPIKSHGREALERVTASAGKCLPWDRHWAVAHELSKFDGANWAPCQNFMIGTRTPGLAGLWAEFDEGAGVITLRHQDLGTLTFAPETDRDKFLSWIAPLCPPDRAEPRGIVRAEDRGMTDTDYASVSIMNLASHDAVATAANQPLEIERWRGNIWVSNLPAWEEFSWVGKRLRVGTAVFEVRERIRRCLHTAANPVTGTRDVDTLGTLENNWGHKDFGVYAVVVQSGEIALGDRIEVL